MLHYPDTAVDKGLTTIIRRSTREYTAPTRAPFVVTRPAASAPSPKPPNPYCNVRYAAADDPRHPTGVFIAYRHLLEDLGEGPRGLPGGCLAVGNDSKERISCFKGTVAGDWRSGDNDGDGHGSPSVGGRSTSVAASQLRVFGKPTGLSRVGWVSVVWFALVCWRQCLYLAAR